MLGSWGLGDAETGGLGDGETMRWGDLVNLGLGDWARSSSEVGKPDCQSQNPFPFISTTLDDRKFDYAR